MSDWSDLGLPALNAQGYGYTQDSGLVRTPFATAQARQRRQHLKNTRTFTASVELTQAQLKTAINLFETHGFHADPVTGLGFSIDLLSGHDPLNPISSYAVRLADNYVVSAVGYNLYKVDMVLEVGGRLGPGGGGCLPSCQWCGVGASWDVAESAWDTPGPVWAEVVAIRPIAVAGVEWWKNPRPTTITIMFKYALD